MNLIASPLSFICFSACGPPRKKTLLVQLVGSRCIQSAGLESVMDYSGLTGWAEDFSHTHLWNKTHWQQAAAPGFMLLNSLSSPPLTFLLLPSRHTHALLPSKSLAPPKVLWPLLMLSLPLVGGALRCSVSHQVKQEKQPSVKESESIRRTQPGKHDKCLHTFTTATLWLLGQKLLFSTYIRFVFFFTKVKCF